MTLKNEQGEFDFWIAAMSGVSILLIAALSKRAFHTMTLLHPYICPSAMCDQSPGKQQSPRSTLSHARCKRAEEMGLFHRSLVQVKRVNQVGIKYRNSLNIDIIMELDAKLVLESRWRVHGA